jgi:hypothetical protein
MTSTAARFDVASAASWMASGMVGDATSNGSAARAGSEDDVLDLISSL